jgi:hypothetical protein
LSIKQNNKDENNKKLEVSKKKILFIISSIVAIIIQNSIILYVSPIENKIIYTNWILLFNSSITAGLALLLVINIISKQKILNIHSTAHIALAIGLVLWLCANIQWIIYDKEQVLPDVPSVADLLWLSAYPFLGFSLYLTFKKFYKKYYNIRIFLMCLVCSLFFIMYIFFIITSSAQFTTINDITLFSILLVYPLLNMILIIPAVMIFSIYKKEKDLPISQMFISLSVLSFVIADSWFAIIFLSSLVEAIWYSNLLIVDHYLIMSAGLLWSILSLHPINYTFKFNNVFYKRKEKIT